MLSLHRGENELDEQSIEKVFAGLVIYTDITAITTVCFRVLYIGLIYCKPTGA